MDRQYHRDFVLLRKKLERTRADEAQVLKEIGLRAHTAVGDPVAQTSKSAIGRVLGISHTHVNTLINAALRSTSEELTKEGSR